MSHLKDGANSPVHQISLSGGSSSTVNNSTTAATTAKPIFSIGPTAVDPGASPQPSITLTRSNSTEKNAHANGKVSRIEVSSTLRQDERNTLIASPMQPSLSSLGLAKTGYKHWVARSGTLVANIIMAAGINLLFYLTCSNH